MQNLELTVKENKGLWIARVGTAMATGRTRETAIARVSTAVQNKLMKQEQVEILKAQILEFRRRMRPFSMDSLPVEV